jgi:hypothetical protein
VEHPGHGTAPELEAVLCQIRIRQDRVLSAYASIIVIVRLDDRDLSILSSHFQNTVPRTAVNDTSCVYRLFPGMKGFKLPEYSLS